MDVVGTRRLGTAVEVCLPMTSETSCIASRRVACHSSLLTPLSSFIFASLIAFYRHLFLTQIMHGNYRGDIHRYNGSHGPKRQLLGHHQVPPAWRPDLPSQTGKGKEVRDTGSKIFITRLPFDVSEKEIEVGAHTHTLPHSSLKPVGELIMVWLRSRIFSNKLLAR